MFVLLSAGHFWLEDYASYARVEMVSSNHPITNEFQVFLQFAFIPTGQELTGQHVEETAVLKWINETVEVVQRVAHCNPVVIAEEMSKIIVPLPERTIRSRPPVRTARASVITSEEDEVPCSDAPLSPGGQHYSVDTESDTYHIGNIPLNTRLYFTRQGYYGMVVEQYRSHEMDMVRVIHAEESPEVDDDPMDLGETVPATGRGDKKRKAPATSATDDTDHRSEASGRDEEVEEDDEKQPVATVPPPTRRRRGETANLLGTGLDPIVTASSSSAGSSSSLGAARTTTRGDSRRERRTKADDGQPLILTNTTPEPNSGGSNSGSRSSAVAMFTDGETGDTTIIDVSARTDGGGLMITSPIPVAAPQDVLPKATVPALPTKGKTKLPTPVASTTSGTIAPPTLTGMVPVRPKATTNTIGSTNTSSTLTGMVSTPSSTTTPIRPFHPIEKPPLKDKLNRALTAREQSFVNTMTSNNGLITSKDELMEYIFLFQYQTLPYGPPPESPEVQITGSSSSSSSSMQSSTNSFNPSRFRSTEEQEAHDRRYAQRLADDDEKLSNDQASSSMSGGRAASSSSSSSSSSRGSSHQHAASSSRSGGALRGYQEYLDATAGPHLGPLPNSEEEEEQQWRILAAKSRTMDLVGMANAAALSGTKYPTASPFAGQLPNAPDLRHTPEKSQFMAANPSWFSQQSMNARDAAAATTQVSLTSAGAAEGPHTFLTSGSSFMGSQARHETLINTYPVYNRMANLPKEIKDWVKLPVDALLTHVRTTTPASMRERLTGNGQQLFNTVATEYFKFALNLFVRGKNARLQRSADINQYVVPNRLNNQTEISMELHQTAEENHLATILYHYSSVKPVRVRQYPPVYRSTKADGSSVITQGPPRESFIPSKVTLPHPPNTRLFRDRSTNEEYTFALNKTKKLTEQFLRTYTAIQYVDTVREFSGRNSNAVLAQNVCGLASEIAEEEHQVSVQELAKFADELNELTQSRLRKDYTHIMRPTRPNKKDDDEDSNNGGDDNGSNGEEDEDDDDSPQTPKLPSSKTTNSNSGKFSPNKKTRQLDTTKSTTVGSGSSTGGSYRLDLTLGGRPYIPPQNTSTSMVVSRPRTDADERREAAVASQTVAPRFQTHYSQRIANMGSWAAQLGYEYTIQDSYTHHFLEGADEDSSVYLYLLRQQQQEYIDDRDDETDEDRAFIDNRSDAQVNADVDIRLPHIPALPEAGRREVRASNLLLLARKAAADRRKLLKDGTSRSGTVITRLTLTTELYESPEFQEGCRAGHEQMREMGMSPTPSSSTNYQRSNAVVEAIPGGVEGNCASLVVSPVTPVVSSGPPPRISMADRYQLAKFTSASPPPRVPTSSPSRSSRTYEDKGRAVHGVKLPKFDGNADQTASEYINQLMNYYQLTAMGVENYAPMLHFSLRETNRDLVRRMEMTVKTEKMTFMDHFQSLLQMFRAEYKKDDVTILSLQMRFPQVKKGIDEPIEDYLRRFDRAYHTAYPDATPSSVQDKISRLMISLDEDVRNDYLRTHSTEFQGDSNHTRWAGTRDRIINMYHTRNPLNEHHAAQQRLIIEQAERKSSHHLTRIDARHLESHLTDPFINPPTSAGAKKRLQPAPVEVVDESHNRFRRRNNRPNGRSNAVVEEEVEEAMTLINATSTVAKPVKKPLQVVTMQQKQQVQRPFAPAAGSANATPMGGNGNTDSLPLTAAPGVASQSNPTAAPGPCIGHERACGVNRHTWEYCPRNQGGKRANVHQAHTIGDHPDLQRINESVITGLRVGFMINSSSRSNAVNTDATNSPSPPPNLQISGLIHGVPFNRMLTDTGSERSLVLLKEVLKLGNRVTMLPPPSIRLIAANQTAIHPVGQIQVPMKMMDKANGKSYTRRVTLLVMKELNCPIILGWDILNTFFRIIDLGSRRCEFIKDLQPDNTSSPFINVEQSANMLVTNKKTIGPHSSASVNIRIDTQRWNSSTRVIMCEPHPAYDLTGRQIDVQFHTHIRDREHRYTHDYTVEVFNETEMAITLQAGTNIGLASLCDADLTPKGMAANMNVIQSSVGPIIIPDAASSSSADPLPVVIDDTPELVFATGPTLTDEQRELLLIMLRRNRDAFAPMASAPPPPTLGVSHAIHLMDPSPIKQVPYKLSPVKATFVNDMVQGYLNNKLIVPSSSPWSSPIVVVPKADGSMRMCIDYRRLNAATKKDAYPMPLIEHCLTLCKDAKWLSIIDIQDAYHHILMEPSSQSATAFCTDAGLFEWNVMPFGLCNAPATFQRHVDTVLKEFIGKICAAFFDDIVVYTDGSIELHIEHVESILKKLASTHLSAKVKKCKFGFKSILFVGHIVTEGKISPDPEKLRAIRDWVIPTTVVQTQSFIGLANYYRKFIANFSLICSPLHALTRKDAVWEWGHSEQGAFDKLKAALISAPCLHGPNFKFPFILQTDASIHGLGAVLTQLINEEEHPIGYISRALNNAEQNYAAVEWECLAVVWACESWQHYLIDSTFTIVTDSIALKSLPSRRLDNKRMMRWAIKLAQYSFIVVHRKGRNNANADALSRNPLPNSAPPEPIEGSSFTQPPPSLVAIVSEADDQMNDTFDNVENCNAVSQSNNSLYSLVDEVFLQQVIDSQRSDPSLMVTIRYLEDQEVPINFDADAKRKLIRTASRHVMVNTTEPAGLYFFDNDASSRHYFPTNPRLVIPLEHRASIIAIYHSSPFGGHLGIRRTFHKLSSLYYWNQMFDDTTAFINGCHTCQTEKARLRDPVYAAMRMEDPTSPFQVISTDYIGPLTQSGDFKYVITFIDHFTKFAIAIPTKDHTATTTASILVNEVICKYGSPAVLLSDGGSEFKSTMMEQVYKMTRIEKRFSSAYHPQSNGTVERFNGTLKQVLRTLCESNKHNWSNLLQPAVFAYNTTMADAIGMSPFEAVHGRTARMPFTPYDSSLLNDSAGDRPTDEYAMSLQQTMQLANQHVIIQMEAKQDDVNTRNRESGTKAAFKVGDVVYVRSGATLNRKSGKFGHTAPFMPHRYTIIDRMNEVTYSLRRQHDTIIGLLVGASTTRHVSHLKLYRPYDTPSLTVPSQSIPSADGIPRIPSAKSSIVLPTNAEMEANRVDDSIGKRVRTSRSKQVRPSLNESVLANDSADAHHLMYSQPIRGAPASSSTSGFIHPQRINLVTSNRNSDGTYVEAGWSRFIGVDYGRTPNTIQPGTLCEYPSTSVIVDTGSERSILTDGEWNHMRPVVDTPRQTP